MTSSAELHAGVSASVATAGVTIFAMPKAFAGHIGVIQRNAITSWTRMCPRPQIILFGDDAGTAEVAAAFEVQHVPYVARNEQGTPLVNDLFDQARRLAEHRLLAYVNADIILLGDFLTAVRRMHAAPFECFLLIGRRIDMDITKPLDFDGDWERSLRNKAAQHGKLAARVCKDYFVFPQSEFGEVPAFAIGRANWDNWMVYHAHTQDMPVVDATRVITAIHQNHGYSHLVGGRNEAYVKGAEAKCNKKLAGGMHLVRGSAANWLLTPSTLRRSRSPSALVPFLADSVAFAKLLFELFGRNKGAPST